MSQCWATCLAARGECSHSSWGPWEAGLPFWKAVVSVERSACMHSTEPIICSRKWGWHRPLDSLGKPGLPSICRWARQVVRSPGFNSAVFILCSPLSNACEIREGRGMGARAKTLMADMSLGPEGVRGRQHPGDQVKHSVRETLGDSDFMEPRLQPNLTQFSNSMLVTTVSFNVALPYVNSDHSLTLTSS